MSVNGLGYVGLPQRDALGRLWRKSLALLAVTLLAVYLGWNIYWLAQGRLAPSLFVAITGLPCATTGCTRSLMAWGRGDWLQALRYNPLSLAFVVLLVASGCQIALQLFRRKRLALHQSLAWGWGVNLTVGWIYKLLSDPAYW